MVAQWTGAFENELLFRDGPPNKPEWIAPVKRLPNKLKITMMTTNFSTASELQLAVVYAFVSPGCDHRR